MGCFLDDLRAFGINGFFNVKITTTTTTVFYIIGVADMVLKHLPVVSNQKACRF